uniref:PABPN1 like, cytoplasmic n=1 Tax=Marmota marmota marmota TaxID=9994 RepID=A0A8C5ZAK0_MARMA
APCGVAEGWAHPPGRGGTEASASSWGGLGWSPWAQELPSRRLYPVQRRVCPEGAVTLCQGWLSPSQVDCGQGLQELEAIRLKLWALEQAKQRPEPPSIQGRTRAEDGTGTGRLLSSPGTTGCPFPGTPKEKVEADHRSIYVGNVDYGGTARELEAHFHHCGQVYRVTILCDKFSGHPKGYAYIEFATKSSAQAAMELDESIFRGRVIKVLPKRTNFPGISSTDRGGLRGPSASRAAAFLCSDLQCRSRFRPRGQPWAHGRASPRFSPY